MSNNSKSIFKSTKSWWNNRSIQTKIVSLIIIFVLAPVIWSSAYELFVLRPNEINKGRNNLKLQVDDKALSLENQVEGQIDTVAIISEFFAVKDVLIENNPTTYNSLLTQVDNFLFSIAKNTENLAQARVLNSTGWEISRVDVDPLDRTQVSIKPKDKLQYKGDRYYFTDAIVLENGEIFTSNLDLNQEKGKVQVLSNGAYVPVIRHAIPIYDGSTVVGLVIVNYFFDELYNQVFEEISNIYTESEVSLIESEGFYTFSTGENVWTSPVNLNTEKTIFTDYSPPDDFLAVDQQDDLIGSSIFTMKRIDVKFTEKTFNLYLLIVTPVTFITSTIDQQTFVLIFFTVVVAILSVIIAIVIVRKSIINPIQGIVEESDRIAKGDLRSFINNGKSSSTPRTDEIGILQNQFGVMRNNLIGLIKEIVDASKNYIGYMEQLYLASDEVRTMNRNISGSISEINQGINQQANQNHQVSELIIDHTEIVVNMVSQVEETLELIKEINEEVTFIALNAQIESARVGAVGRGFMVVASSIKDLAQKSKDQLKEIQQKMKTIKDSVDTSVSKIQTNIENLSSTSEEIVAINDESSTNLLYQADLFEEMVNLIQQLNNMSKGLSSTTQAFTLSEGEVNN